MGDGVEHAATFAEGDLVAMVITANLTLPSFVPYSVGNALYEEWEKFVADWNADAPENLQILQTSRLWPALIMDRNLQTTAVQGIFIALALSGVVLLIATGNWIITASRCLRLRAWSSAFSASLSACSAGRSALS